MRARAGACAPRLGGRRWPRRVAPRAVPTRAPPLPLRTHPPPQAVWALGNIAGDSARLRDLVLSHGAMGPLGALLGSAGVRPSMLRNATWAVSNLFRCAPRAGGARGARGPSGHGRGAGPCRARV